MGTTVVGSDKVRASGFVYAVRKACRAIGAFVQGRGRGTKSAPEGSDPPGELWGYTPSGVPIYVGGSGETEALLGVDGYDFTKDLHARGEVAVYEAKGDRRHIVKHYPDGTIERIPYSAVRYR